MKTVLVAGTGSWKLGEAGDWYFPDSPFVKLLTEEGVEVKFDGNGIPRPFVWDTALAGVPFFTSTKEWAAAGASLAYFARPATNLIVHSHGLQVALFSLADWGLKADVMISVGSPVREDMMEVAKRARKNIGFWLHIHSDSSDRWQWYGELFDGGWKHWFPGGEPRIVRTHPLADVNDSVPGVGHSELLRDPSTFHFWKERGWLEKLK